MAQSDRSPDAGSALAAPSGRWSPAGELDELHRRMDQFLQGLLPGAAGDGGAMWSPLVDIEETEDAWIIEAEVPGARPEDIDVEVDESALRIHGEIKEREREGILRRRMRARGEFDFRVTLPGGADAENIDATLDNGVLTVRVPKPEQARPRRIEVGSSGNGSS